MGRNSEPSPFLFDWRDETVLFFLFEEKEGDGMDDTFERHLSRNVSSSVSHG
jgi:hypothetical protein